VDVSWPFELKIGGRIPKRRMGELLKQVTVIPGYGRLEKTSEYLVAMVHDENDGTMQLVEWLDEHGIDYDYTMMPEGDDIGGRRCRRRNKVYEVSLYWDEPVMLTDNFKWLKSLSDHDDQKLLPLVKNYFKSPPKLKPIEVVDDPKF
jgi:hypothetical protein